MMRNLLAVFLYPLLGGLAWRLTHHPKCAHQWEYVVIGSGKTYTQGGFFINDTQRRLHICALCGCTSAMVRMRWRLPPPPGRGG